MLINQFLYVSVNGKNNEILCKNEWRIMNNYVPLNEEKKNLNTSWVMIRKKWFSLHIWWNCIVKQWYVKVFPFTLLLHSIPLYLSNYYFVLFKEGVYSRWFFCTKYWLKDLLNVISQFGCDLNSPHMFLLIIVGWGTVFPILGTEFLWFCTEVFLRKWIWCIVIFLRHSKKFILETDFRLQICQVVPL